MCIRDRSHSEFYQSGQFSRLVRGLLRLSLIHILDAVVSRYEAAHDDYNAIMAKALALSLIHI